jgi:hypothetical protein
VHANSPVLGPFAHKVAVSVNLAAPHGARK